MRTRPLLISFVISIFGIGSSTFAALRDVNSCVQVYYDRSPNADYWMGRTYANMIQNLLGHWPELQQIVSPIEFYKKGDIENCRSTIYIASYFENAIPQAFLEDYITTKKNVAWLGYSIWKIDPELLEKTMGFRYSHLDRIDPTKLEYPKIPDFFKDVHYKGEVFSKFAEWSRAEKPTFAAPWEQIVLKLNSNSNDKPTVLAEVEHSQSKEKVPYILRSKNRFYVAEVPLSYIHESDRYLVFADLLFDILDLPPRHNGKYAFLRIEDIHPLIDLAFLNDVVKLLNTEKVPTYISLIPFLFDPFHVFSRKDEEEFVSISQKKEFQSYLNSIKSAETGFIWHGVTHQYERTRNPHDGASGADFEFWDAVLNKPVAKDSVPWVLRRLEEGQSELRKNNIKASMWLTPHYQASPLDYLIFAKVFPWNVGRVIYFNHRASGLPKEDPRLWLLNNEKEYRAKAFENLKVEITSPQWTGQIYPYEIYGDIYGQRLIPENLGNSQPTISAHVVRPRSIEQMLADAKRNLVLRDVWASSFFHSYLVDKLEHEGIGIYPGDTEQLKKLIQGLKNLGYQFININEFIEKNTKPPRPRPIERE